MNHDLVARYIYAVTRHLPPKTRADVEQELDSLISDMLAERRGDILPTEKDTRIVLTELGPPEELAAKYSGDENKSLIGGIYFLLYKRVLWIILPVAVAGLMFANLLTMVLGNPSDSYSGWEMVGQIIGGAAGGFLQAFAIVTIIFAIFSYKKVNFNDGDFFSKLPPVPKKNEQIKPHEPIINIFFIAFAAVVFIGFPQVIGVWLEGTGWIPLFTISVVRNLWPPIVLWTVLNISKELIKLIEGRYSARLAYGTLAVNVLVMVCAAFIFLNNRMINPDFLTFMADLMPGNTIVSALFTHVHLLFLAVVGFPLIIETIVTLAKAWKYSKA